MADFGQVNSGVWTRMAQQGVTAFRLGLLALCATALLLAGCEATDTPTAAADEAPAVVAAAPLSASPERSNARETADEQRAILVLGDSLSAAYNLAAEQGWVALLEPRLREQGAGFRLVNASISGETTAGGRSRIAAALAEHRPAVVVIELGANDGLRGLPLEETRANLDAMVQASQAAGAKVLVIGMRLPPNYGPDYTDAFFNQFGEIAAARGAAHLPFLLEPIANDDSAFQSDRLHPTAEAQPLIADHVWPSLAPVLEAAAR